MCNNAGNKKDFTDLTLNSLSPCTAAISKPRVSYTCFTFSIDCMIWFCARDVHIWAVRKLTLPDFVCRKACPFTKKKSTYRCSFLYRCAIGSGNDTFSILFLIGTFLIIFPCNNGVGVPNIICALLISSIIMSGLRIRFLFMIRLNFCKLGHPISCCNCLAFSAPLISSLVKYSLLFFTDCNNEYSLTFSLGLMSYIA